MNPGEPWLSILLPVYNVSPYLEPCLASILSQPIDGVEIILLDDASTDDSAQVMARLQQQCAGTLRLLRHARNRGLSAARNSLLREARGRYVWFLDSDDVLCSGAIERLRSIVATDAPDLVLCDFQVVRNHVRLKHRLRGESHRRTFAGDRRRTGDDRSRLIAGLLAMGQLHCWSKIARRSAWQRVTFPEGRYFEDMAVLPQLIEAVRTYRYVAEPWVGYRQREGSILASFSADKVHHLAEALDALHAALLQLPGQLQPEALFAIDHFCLKSYASLARRLRRGGFDDAAALARVCHRHFTRIFPHGPKAVLGGYLRRGWWLRAARAKASLRRAGFLSSSG